MNSEALTPPEEIQALAFSFGGTLLAVYGEKFNSHAAAEALMFLAIHMGIQGFGEDKKEFSSYCVELIEWMHAERKKLREKS